MLPCLLVVPSHPPPLLLLPNVSSPSLLLLCQPFPEWDDLDGLSLPRKLTSLFDDLRRSNLFGCAECDDSASSLICPLDARRDVLS